MFINFNTFYSGWDLTQKWRCRYEKNNSNYKVSYIRNGRIIVYSINTDSKRYIVYRKIKAF